MPSKRVNLAMSLKAQGPRKAVRVSAEEGGPLIACVRQWGSAAPVFSGLAVTFKRL